MVLGTPMIGCIVNVIQENEIDALVTPCINAHVSYLLVVQWVTATLEDDKVTTKVLDPTKYDEVFTTKGSKTIDAFSPKITHVQMKTAFPGVRLNVMTHDLCADEGILSQGLIIQNVYANMHNGRKDVAIVVRNRMVYHQTLKKIPVVRVIAANQVPEPQVWPGMIDTLDESQGIQTQKLTTELRQEKLFEKVELSGLESWSLKLAESAHSFLAEYHNIFYLEPCELGCTHLTKHVVKITDDTPFKEWFKQIPPPLVEEVHAHLQELLDSGAICPSQSAWCNAAVLVQEKDRSLCFCIDFCHLNAYTKKDSYPLPRIQEALESCLVSAGHFSCLDLKSRFWQIKMDEMSKQYTTFIVGNLGFFECGCMPSHFL